MPDEPRLASESIAGQRPYQEDAVLVRTLSDGRVLVAVADGMGGHAAGEVASGLALETLHRALEDGVTLDRAFELANQEVHEKARDPGKRGMGTTLTAVLIDDGEFMIANVGDSRGYLLSGDGIRQVTEDHSFVAEAMKRGQSEKQAMATPYRDALTRSIGTDPEVEVDVFGPFPVMNDTALLVCSDGLYKTLADDDLRSIYLESGSPRGAAQSLVASALDQGSDDNISVAVAEFGEVSRTPGRGTLTMAYDPAEADANPGPVTAEEEVSPREEATRGDMPPVAPPEPRLDTWGDALRRDEADQSVVAPDPGRPPLPLGGMIAVGVVAVGVLLWLLLG